LTFAATLKTETLENCINYRSGFCD